MRIEYIDSAYAGDNLTKRLDIFVDEQWRSFATYLYFVPVVGDEVYASAEITLDENGEASYYVSGDILNGEGYFGCQIVCLSGSVEIAKSQVYTFECGESIDDNEAVLPTGRVVTLAELYERLESLTASDVGYIDTELIGADNVQDAIDYALTHGGGGSDLPTYTMMWSPEAETVREQNFAVINQIRDLAVGSYLLYLQIGATTRLTVYEIRQGSTFKVSFRGSFDSESDSIYEISAGSNIRSYDQERYDIPAAEFDPTSYAAPSMIGTAEYINERIGTTGNLDPSSYASTSDVDAIEAKIPSAASPQNQLADKAYVTTELGGKQDTLTEVEQSAVDSGITSAKVTAYDAHVANTVIHVTASDKIEWSDKYDLPTNGIPKSDLAGAVQTSLGKADTALQAVPSGYATETYVDTAISTAIGQAIGGSY